MKHPIFVDKHINIYYYMSIIKYNDIGGDKLSFIEIFKALGDVNRIRILNLLIRQELCVCEIETILGMTQSNASRHLNKLKSAGIIASRKKSQWVYYRIDDKFVKENRLLYEFLKEKIEENTQCLEDTKRFNKYKSNNFTCKQIKEDKNKVIRHIKGQCYKD